MYHETPCYAWLKTRANVWSSWFPVATRNCRINTDVCAFSHEPNILCRLNKLCFPRMYEHLKIRVDTLGLNKMPIYLKFISEAKHKKYNNCDCGRKLWNILMLRGALLTVTKVWTIEAPLLHLPGLAILRNEISSNWYVFNKNIASDAFSIPQIKVSYCHFSSEGTPSDNGDLWFCPAPSTEAAAT